MATITKNLGPATAYGYAKEKGYTGTEEEFAQLLGNIAEDLSNIENLTVTVSTLPAGSDATASYADGVLSLGIPKGDKGDTGATPNLSIGTVSTLPAGDDATATITGTAAAPVLNLGIPEGQAGDANNLAADYSSSKTYSVGEYCIYDGSLYRCTTAITTAEAWDSTHWTAAVLGDDVSDLKSAFEKYEDYKILPLSLGDFVANSYVKKTDGSIDSYSGWSRTDYIDIGNAKKIIAKSNVSSDYNCFYDSSKNYINSSSFLIGTTDTEIDVPNGAKYVIFSNTDSGMRRLVVKYYSNLVDETRKLENEVKSNEGELYYVVPIKSGTINAAGQEQSRTDRLVSTEYLYINQYAGEIGIPENHSILIAYYDLNKQWISNSGWMNTCKIEDLTGYPFVRIVLRNDLHISDDISGEIGVIQLKLHKAIFSSATLTEKTDGNGLFISPVEMGGLKQVARLGWNVYANTTPPEQSIPSYMLAYENGCRIMLADLRIASSGDFVCRHDSDLGGNTVMNTDGTALTAEEKAQLVADLTLTQLDQYDFGIYKGIKYAGTKILRLEDFLKFCKVMNCIAMIETKVEMTAEQTQEVINMIKYYGMSDNLVWAENAYATWGGVTLPLVNAQLPNAVIHLRGGSGNLTRCIEYAEQYATPEKHVEISFLNYADITDSVLATFIDKNIDAAFSEVKNAETYAGVVTSGLIYKLKSVASSYWDFGKLFADKYRGGNILA